MGYRRPVTDFPAWTATVGSMKEARDARPEACAVKVSCDTCKEWRDVDLDALIRAKGQWFSLVNKRGRCKLTKGCRGYNYFRYQSGVMRPLSTEKQTERWAEADEERKVLEQHARQRLADALQGRVMRFDKAPIGIDQLLWAFASDRERRELIRRARD
jgi:hypothetical protein